MQIDRKFSLSTFSLFVVISLVLIFAATKIGDPAPNSGIIILDGFFDDWKSIETTYVDQAGDGAESGFDIKNIQITNQDGLLLIHIDLTNETNLQNGSGLILSIDTDNDSSTGTEIANIGADFIYDLGKRQGRYYRGSAKFGLDQDNIGLITMPTVTSTEFEIAIALKDAPDNKPLFPSDTIKLVFNQNVDEGDTAPDVGDTIEYTIDPELINPPPPSISLEKENNNAIRMVSFNVLNDGLLKSNRVDHFKSILQAVQPDIINLQEMYVTQAPKIEAAINEWLPLDSGTWHVNKMGDLVTISKFPFVLPEIGRLPIISGASAVILQINETQQLIIVNSHFRCCDQEELRQNQIDEVNSFIKDMKSFGGDIDFSPNTPFVLLGDMNLVGYAQQRNSLIFGDIVNEEKFGSDFSPDWDGTPLTDLVSRHTESRQTYTWRDENTTFSPGRLDYFIYSDSAMEIAKHYLLDTAELPQDKLDFYGLHADDSSGSTDHLTFVVDILLK